MATNRARIIAQTTNNKVAHRPFWGSYDVARDGRFLMILPGNESTAAAPRSIVVVQNFGEERKDRVGPSGK